MEDIYIIAAKRTPIGGFLGTLSTYSAVDLGVFATNAVLETLNGKTHLIEEVVFGNVLSANLGQSPARQIALKSGISNSASATTINKVCASGLKAVIYGSQSIALSQSNTVLAGGTESMSNVPFYLNKYRNGNKLGHLSTIDGLLKDGLTDPYHDVHMGEIAELLNTKNNVSRDVQDNYAINSYQKANTATKNGSFKNEIVSVKLKNGDDYTEDEDIFKLLPEKVSHLKPTFSKTGSITPANASNLNDGAAAIVLANKEIIKGNQIQPLAKIIGFADAAQDPQWFTTSPFLAIQKILSKTTISIEDIDLFEINEAYANVPLVNAKMLKIDLNKVNVNGGAIALGHPLGASGARILTTLIHALINRKEKYGIAAICNGGGGASAVLIENMKL